MYYIDIGTALLQLEQSDRSRHDWLQELVSVFDNVCVFRDCWGSTKFCSSDVAGDCDRIDIDPHCHNCPGQPIKVWPFVYLDKGERQRLYSDPPCFVIAYPNSGGFGVVPDLGWRERMVLSGIGDRAIEKVGWFLKNHASVSYAEVDDE